MKIARFLKQGSPAYGILKDDQVQPLSGGPFDDPRPQGEPISLDQIKLLPPVEPSKIICVGRNYQDHIKELNLEVPSRPSVFLKPPTCLIGPDDPIIIPPKSTRVDYEGELAVIFRRTFHGASEKDALDNVLGFSCFNDVTERDLVKQAQSNLTIAKGFDTFGPIGPWIETEADPENLTVATRLNGKIVQQGNTADCIFSVAFLISYVSHCMTILPGDVLITGTPEGVGPLEPGDIVSVEIEGIGKLSNPVSAVSPAE